MTAGDSSADGERRARRLHLALLVAGVALFAIALRALWWASVDFLDLPQVLRPAVLVALVVYALATSIVVAARDRSARAVVVAHALSWPASLVVAAAAIVGTGAVDVVGAPIDAMRSAALARDATLERWWIEPTPEGPRLRVVAHVVDEAYVALDARGRDGRPLAAGSSGASVVAPGRRDAALPLQPLDDADRAALRVTLDVRRARASATIEHTTSGAPPPPGAAPAERVVVRTLPPESRP